MAASKPFGPVVATRRISTLGTRPKRVTITLGKPRLPKGESDWECPFRISGGGIRVLEYGYGVDSMQALAGAYGGVRYYLEKTGESFEWYGIQVPVAGIQMFVPMLHPSLTRRLEKMIIAEVRLDTARLRRRHQQRQKRNREERPIARKIAKKHPRKN